ncbi:hypothetical protein QBC32DRAFT_219681 [Pseudoneurospora amorphoporcata]|uniref:Zn(2)-C6 fungal-type domain-containing protein n=1 Tax=Pseudoneurospora amorphoporcata TaxID=241081 RepID=A0AAN6NR00_9PEZI|nr:hypothetical protein QBC32DRAFT_219681 [Pseudoneurospora amorphoporcata]
MVTTNGIPTTSIMNNTSISTVPVSIPSQNTGAAQHTQHQHSQHTVSSAGQQQQQQQQQAYPTTIPPAVRMSSSVMGAMSSLSPSSAQQQNTFRRASVASSITTATLDDDPMATPLSTPPSIDPNSNNNNLYGPGPTSMGLDMGGMLGAGGGGGNMILGGIGSGMVVGGSSSSSNVSSGNINMPTTTTHLHHHTPGGGFPNIINMPISMPTSMSLTSINGMSPHHHQHATTTHPPYTQHHHMHNNTGGGGGGGVGGQKPIRRRMRMITSCLECRRRKLKCNKCKPCVNCQKFNRECLYLGPKLDEASQMRLTEIKEQVGSLERALERDVAKGAASSSSSSSSGQRREGGMMGVGGFRMVGMGMGMMGMRRGRRGSCISVLHSRDDGDGDGDGDGGEDGELGELGEEEYEEGEEYAESTPFVTEDVAYDENETDDLIDLGIQVGKMRITERIGGMSRPRLAEEIQVGIGSPRSMGGNSSMPNNNPNGVHHQLDTDMSYDAAADLSGYHTVIDQDGNIEHVPDFLRPTAAYIPPTSGFFFGQTGHPPSLLHLLPPKFVGDGLLARYFAAVHPIARCVHKQSFQTLYDGFWLEVLSNIEPRASAQAVVFAAWFSACVSMEEEEVLREYGEYKAKLLEAMKIGTEISLARANFLRTTKVETMQAFVMYMIPLCREEVSRAHSVLVGAAVRMAECMGLHRDGEAFGLNPLETHVRRLIWHQLCFLDIRTCEAQGPKPAIRRDDYDTRLPLNCEEDVFVNNHAGYPVIPQDHQWTSSLLTIMRFEVNQMMRVIWSDRRKLETRKMELPPVISKIENFRKRMLEKYGPLLDDRVPIQRYTRYVMNLLIYRLHAMVLHPYHSNTPHPLTERMNGILIESGIMIIEHSIALETTPEFREWAWYLGAYQQYQIALLLATEIYYRPNNDRADRIWACLDWVFQLERDMPRQEKSLRILTEIQSKTSVYANMRKMRAPTDLVRAVPGKQAIKESPPPPTPTPMMQTSSSAQQSYEQHAQQQQQHAQQQAQAQQQQQQAQVHHHQQQMMIQQQQQQPLVLKQEPGLQTPTMPPSSSMSMSMSTAAAAMASINTLSLPPSMNVNGSLSPAEHHYHQQQQQQQHQHQLLLLQQHHHQAQVHSTSQHMHHPQAAQHAHHAPVHHQQQHHQQQHHSHQAQQQHHQWPPHPPHQPHHPHNWHNNNNNNNMPPPNMVYAGVSDGAVLWGLPPCGNPGSPAENSSDGGSVVGACGHAAHQQHGSAQHRNGSICAGLDGASNIGNGNGNGSGNGNGGNGNGAGTGAGTGGSVGGGGGGSGNGGRGGGTTIGGGGVGGMNVDWNLIESLFPTHPETGQPSFQAFAEPVISFVDGVPVPTMPSSSSSMPFSSSSSSSQQQQQRTQQQQTQQQQIQHGQEQQQQQIQHGREQQQSISRGNGNGQASQTIPVRGGGGQGGQGLKGEE